MERWGLDIVQRWGLDIVERWGRGHYNLCTMEQYTHTLSLSCSWGPEDKGATVEGPGLVAQVRTALTLTHTPSHIVHTFPPHRRLSLLQCLKDDMAMATFLCLPLGTEDQ